MFEKNVYKTCVIFPTEKWEMSNYNQKQYK